MNDDMTSLILELMNDTVLITNNQREFMYICPNIHYIFGFSVNEVRRKVKIEYLLGKEIIPFHNQVLHNQVVNNLEIQIYDKNKIPHNLLINMKQVNINGGTVLYTCRDISDLRQVERKLKKSMQEALCQRNARFVSIEKTIAAITAEISNPLHTIKLLTDTLLHWEKKDKIKEISQNKEHILNKISRLAANTQNIIINYQEQIQRPDSFYQDVISINSYLHEFLNLYEKDIKNSCLSVELNLNNSLPKCLISSAHLYEVMWIFFNFFSRKITEKIKPIILATEEDEDNIILKIISNDLKMNEYEKIRAFDPFFLAYQDKNQTDTNIDFFNLYLAHNILQSNKANIMIKDHEPGGLLFVIYLRKEKQACKL